MECHNETIHHHRIVIRHDRNGSDIELAVGDEKAAVKADDEHKGELHGEQKPRHKNREKFRRLISRWKPAMHILIWMLVTTQVFPSNIAFEHAD